VSKDFKEMQFRPNIADHDLQTKIRQIQKFLEKQKQVRIVVKMVGRENQHKDLAILILDKIEMATKSLGRMDPNRRLDGNNFMTTISPFKSQVIKAKAFADKAIKDGVTKEQAAESLKKMLESPNGEETQ